MHKLGVIVPYRNRPQHLKHFLPYIKRYLSSNKIDYHIIVVEQDNGKLFNRGKLLNIGFIEAKKHGCDYVVFHDIDMLPVEVDYSYSDVPLHLATDLTSPDKTIRPIADDYFGGVTLFPTQTFENINGYSNLYWGWGFEDDDLMHRCIKKKVPLGVGSLKNTGAKGTGLRFNGHSSYIELNNHIRWKQDFGIFISLQPDDIILDHEKRDDTMGAFGTPGFDFMMGYNSFKRYLVETFDSRKEFHNLISNIKPTYFTNLFLNFHAKEKKLEFFQDGEYIGHKILEHNLYHYPGNKKLFLGAVDPRRKGEEKYFKGVIDRFATYGKVLDRKEIKEISANPYFGLTSSYGDYTSCEFLTTYYDAKFIKQYKLIDLSGNKNHGYLNDCEMVKCNFEEAKKYPIPLRRTGKFSLLHHRENGFLGSSWKDLNTRWNQLRFTNEIRTSQEDITVEGLSSCKFRTYSKDTKNKVTTLYVGI